MTWGYVALAAGTVVAGSMSADASKDAAGQQASAAGRASEAQLAPFNQTQRNLSPYMEAGKLSLASLSDLLGLPPKGKYIAGGQSTLAYNPITRERTGQLIPRDQFNADAYLAANPDVAVSGMDPYQHYVQYGYKEDRTFGISDPNAPAPTAGPNTGKLIKPFGLEDFQASPAYQFNLEQGQKAIEKAAAKRGNFYAPATLQDIAKFSQGLASNEFQNAYSNYNTNLGNVWNRLYSLSSGGQNAAANLGGFGTTVGSQVSNNIIGAGNAQAAGTVGSANAYTGIVNNLANQYMMQQILANNQRSSVPMSNYGANPEY